MQTENQSLKKDEATSFSRSSKKYQIIRLVNHLLKTCQHLALEKNSKSLGCIPSKINRILELSPYLYVYFYEILCGFEIIDKKWPPLTFDDHIHNTQAVIDSLSLDVLHEDLSYLTGEAVCKPHLTSVQYLLEILESIHEWIYCDKSDSSFQKASIISNYQKNESIQVQLKNDNQMPTKKIDEILKYEKEVSITLDESKSNPKEAVFDNIFKNYMKQKELEFKLKREKSTSGNSSLSSSQDNLIQLVNGREKQEMKFEENNTSSISNKDILLVETIDNEIKSIRNALEKNFEANLYKNKWIKKVYEDELQNTCETRRSEFQKTFQESDHIKDELIKAFNQKNIPNQSRASLKVNQSSRSRGVLLPRSKSLVNYSKYKRVVTPDHNRLEEQSSESNTSKEFTRKIYSKSFLIDEKGIMNALLEEFPHLKTTPQTMSYLWKQHSKQIEMLTHNYNDIKRKYLNLRNVNGESEKVAYKNLLDEAYTKQKRLMEIMRNDLICYERFNDFKRNLVIENSVKAQKREDRCKNAKIKRYINEFCLEHRARMLKQSTDEELIFKRLFDDCLRIQKERMLEMKKYSREKSQIIFQNQSNKIQSIENIYKNKLDLFNEKIKSEKNEAELRERAQNLALRQLKKEFKEKLENRIINLNDQINGDRNFLHWRQIDAETTKLKLLKAEYLNLK